MEIPEMTKNSNFHFWWHATGFARAGHAYLAYRYMHLLSYTAFLKLKVQINYIVPKLN
jgi:hypothetical protein